MTKEQLDNSHVIEIWEPKYSTNTVLVDTRKVRLHNIIVFTKAKSLEGKKFYINGQKLSKCPTVSNGKIACYDVPMSYLKDMEEIFNGQTT